MRLVVMYLAVVSGGAVALTAIFFALGHSSAAAIWPATIIAMALGAAAWRESQPADAALPLRWPDWTALTIGGLFVARTVLWLAWERGGSLYVGSPLNLGDFSLHLTHLQHLARPSHFWPANPIAGADPLAYPLGVTLWQRLLLGAGFPILGVFAAASLLGLTAGVIAAWRWGGAFGLAALLGNGGLAGWAVLGGEVADFQAELAWKNIPLAMLVTQRGLLYALPAGLWLMHRWQRALLEGAGKLTWLDVWVYATLPLFHLHTFLALSFVLGCWFVALPCRQRVLGYGLAALPMAAALAWGCTGGGRQTGAASLAWGWFARTDQGAFAALWENFALWLALLPAIGLWLAWRLLRRTATPEERIAAAWAGPGLALLGGCLIGKLQPWAWDNTKLMLWGWLMTTPFTWNLWLRRLPRLFSWPLVVLLLGGGCATLLAGMANGMRGGYVVTRLADLDGATIATRNLAPDEVVAAAPDYNQPLLLAGQCVVLGYEGHLWSHGIAYQQRLDQLHRLMNGTPDWHEAALALNVRYLYWGNLEAMTYPDSTRAWRGSAHEVIRTPAGVLYRLPD